MRKRLIPYCHASNVYSVDISFFVKQKISIIFMDLDNTLDSYKQLSPTKKAVELKNKLKDVGIEMIILSNNTSTRVSNYANELGVRYFSGVGKPFAKKIKRIIKDNGFNVDSIMAIGDQTVTDIQAANGAGIKSMLVDKLVKEDQPTTRFNRMFDKIYRKKLAKKNLLVEWDKIQSI